ELRYGRAVLRTQSLDPKEQRRGKNGRPPCWPDCASEAIKAALQEPDEEFGHASRERLGETASQGIRLHIERRAHGIVSMPQKGRTVRPDRCARECARNLSDSVQLHPTATKIQHDIL